MTEFETLVKDAVIETWGLEPDRYDADTAFFALGADSLDVVELFMVVEEKLGIPDIPDTAAEHIITPADLALYLGEHVSGKESVG